MQTFSFASKHQKFFKFLLCMPAVVWFRSVGVMANKTLGLSYNLKDYLPDFFFAISGQEFFFNKSIQSVAFIVKQPKETQCICQRGECGRRSFIKIVFVKCIGGRRSDEDLNTVSTPFTCSCLLYLCRVQHEIRGRLSMAKINK